MEKKLSNSIIGKLLNVCHLKTTASSLYSILRSISKENQNANLELGFHHDDVGSEKIENQKYIASDRAPLSLSLWFSFVTPKPTPVKYRNKKRLWKIRIVIPYVQQMSNSLSSTGTKRSFSVFVYALFLFLPLSMCAPVIVYTYHFCLYLSFLDLLHSLYLNLL